MKRALISMLVILAVAASRQALADAVLVSAAASLTDALGEIGRAFARDNPQTTVRFNFGASGALQQQILQGAPVDVFASASPAEMDALQRANRVLPGTRVDFTGNRLVLIAPVGSGLRHWSDLASAAVRRVAISNPDSVPSGRYTVETLTKRGLWDAVRKKAVFGENVRQTLTYVAGGNVDAGIVFATDAQIEKQRVRRVDIGVPGQDHTPIVYPAAVLTGAPNQAGARKFVAFLQSPAAQGILFRYGFEPPRAAPRLTPSTHRGAPARKPALRSKGGRR